MNKNIQIKVSAPCKVYLLGEHSAVYCKPAILTAVGKRMYVTLTPRSDKKIIIKSKGVDVVLEKTEKEILEKTEKSQKLWNEFAKTNDISILKSITKEPLDYVMIAIGEALKFYNSNETRIASSAYNKKLSSGFELEVNSEVPVGAGLGSSSAIAVTVAAAITLFCHSREDGNPIILDNYKDKINQIAYITEHKKNGMPSGGDNSAVCFGGLIWFRKETAELKIIEPISFTLPKKLAANFYLINTGKPEESTGEMVGLVRALNKTKPKLVNKFLEDQEKLVRDLLKVVKDANEEELVRIIREGEKNLESIGVCSPQVKKLIRQIEKAGGAAKICGAGGKTKATGIVLAYHKDKKVIEKIVKENCLDYFTAALGIEGLRQE